jgi:hypothetical protein
MSKFAAKTSLLRGIAMLEQLCRVALKQERHSKESSKLEKTSYQIYFETPPTTPQ